MDEKCPICNSIVGEEFNYCPMCGEPLSALAGQREQLKLSNAIYDKLNKLVVYIKDPQLMDLVKQIMLED